MMREIFSSSPEGALQSLYEGAIYRLPAMPETNEMIQDVSKDLVDVFGEDLCAVHTRYTFDEMKQPLADLRNALLHGERYQGRLEKILVALGLPATDMRRDGLRLRCVMHNGHLNAGAERAYAAHRDTWFGNPQSQINFWIPLHDVTPAQTFTFYPAYFNRAIANTSGDFSYADWMQKAGWQGAKTTMNAAAVDYPRVLTEPQDPEAFSFAAKAGDVVVFAASHLHRTVANASGHTRFSLDFRAVHAADHASGRGAPNPDNASAPDALQDYA